MRPAIVKRNQRVCLVLEFLWALQLGASFATIYLQFHGLNLTQVFGLQSVITIAMIVADLPFGYIADRFGIRRVIVAGTIVQVVQTVWFMGCTSFWEFAVNYMLIGLSMSALSNTTSTVMTRTAAVIDDEVASSQTYQLYEKRKIDARTLAFLVSAIGGGVLVAAGTISTPFWVQPLIFAAGTLVSLGLAKLPQTTTKRRPTFFAIIRTMLSSGPNVRNVILLSVAVQMGGFACVWLLQPRILLTGMPLWAFSLVYLGRSALALLLRRIDVMKRVSPHIMWIMLLLCIPIGAVTAGVTTGYTGLVVLVIMHAFMGASYGAMTLSYLYDALSKDHSTRTTELSVVTTAASLSFMLIGPVTGWVKDTYSLSAAFFMVAAAVLCLGVPALLAFRRHTQ